MPRHYSTSVMVERLIGLLGTKDVSDWEEDFIKSLQRRLADNSLTALTEQEKTCFPSITSWSASRR